MPYINSGKSKLYYEEYGEGPPLIMVHGVGGNHASWFRQVPTFSKHYRTIVFDQRAFGKITRAILIDKGHATARFKTDLPN